MRQRQEGRAAIPDPKIWDTTIIFCNPVTLRFHSASQEIGNRTEDAFSGGLSALGDHPLVRNDFPGQGLQVALNFSLNDGGGDRYAQASKHRSRRSKPFAH